MTTVTAFQASGTDVVQHIRDAAEKTSELSVFVLEPKHLSQQGAMQSCIASLLSSTNHRTIQDVVVQDGLKTYVILGASLMYTFDLLQQLGAKFRENDIRYVGNCVRHRSTAPSTYQDLMEGLARQKQHFKDYY